LPKYECGSLKNDQNPKYKVINLIKRLKNNSKEEYELIAKKCEAKSKEFDLDSVMNEFLCCIKKLNQKNKIRKPNLFKLFLLRVLSHFNRKYN